MRKVDVSGGPYNLVIDRRRGRLVASCWDGSIKILDALDGRMRHTIQSPYRTIPITIVAEDVGRAFVGWRGDTGVVVIDIASGRLLAIREMGAEIRDLALAEAQGLMLIAYLQVNYNDSGDIVARDEYLTAVDLDSLTVRYTIPLDPSEYGLAVDETRGCVYLVRKWAVGGVQAFDIATGRPLGAAALKWVGSSPVLQLCAASSSDRLVIIGMDDTLVVVQASSGLVVWQLAWRDVLGHDASRGGIELVSADDTAGVLYVCCSGVGAGVGHHDPAPMGDDVREYWLVSIDAVDGRVTQRMRVSNFTRAICIDRRRQHLHTAITPTMGTVDVKDKADTLHTFDLRTGAEKGSVQIGHGVHDMVVDERSGRIYVTNSYEDTVTILGD
jgi:hypothetical protein